MQRILRKSIETGLIDNTGKTRAYHEPRSPVCHGDWRTSIYNWISEKDFITAFFVMIIGTVMAILFALLEKIWYKDIACTEETEVVGTERCNENENFPHFPRVRGM